MRNGRGSEASPNEDLPPPEEPFFLTIPNHGLRAAPGGPLMPAMSDSTPEKTPIEKMRNVASDLKEMEHYSRSNIEKLSEFWLLFDEELKQKEFAGKMSDVLAAQNKFQESITALTGDIEIECNRIEHENP